MSGLFGKPSNAVQQQVYTGIQVSTSLYGSCIPYVAGRQRIPFNLLWYGNFQSHATNQSGGGKGGGGSGTKSYTYTTAFIAGLSLGAITAVNRIWHDKSLQSLATENLTLSLGGSAPAIWGGYPGNTPAVQKIPYDHIAYVASSNYNLGSSASMPNLTFEVDGSVPGYSIANSIFDADPSAVVVDYLTDPVRGAGFQGTIAPLTGVSNSYQAYCMSLGLLTSPYENTQRGANEFIRELMHVTNSDVVLSVGTLKVIPYADQAVSGTVAGTAFSYTPNLTPVFSFGDGDYCPHHGDPPVKLHRKPKADTHNIVNVEFSDRSNQYNNAPAGASDLNDIVQNGPRVMPTVTFHQITSASVAKTVAQLILQTSLYERNVYEFKVRSDYSLLEPMDYVAITDANLGLVNQVVRIIEVDDDASNEITLKVMEVPGVVRSTPQYNWAAAQGYAANYATAPGGVLAPVIFQMPAVPASLSEGITLGIAVCAATASTFWGGCNVYCSIDGGTTYSFVGNINSQARYGTITGAMSAVADPDTTSTVPVALANTTLQLSTAVTHAQADTNQTLILVGSGTNAEVMSVGTAALVSAGNYNLSYLRRGLYGSTDQSHLSGVNFVRLDGNIFQIAIDPGYAGQTLSFKFTSFNTWGQAAEQLASVTAYSYTLPVGLPVGGAVALIPRGNCSFTGQHVYKGTGAAAWDSDCVSKIAYQSLSVSAQFSAGGAISVGVATSIGATLQPQSTAGYYGIYAHADSAQTVVFEGSTVVYTGATPVPGDLYLVTYDGFSIRYYINGVLVWTSLKQGLSFYIGLAMLSPGSLFSNVEPVANTGATPTQWVVTGSCTANDTNAMKQGGVSAFDSSAYSIIGYPTCHVTAKLNSIGLGQMVGFATTPQNAASPTVMFTGLYPGNGGLNWYVMEGGVNVGSVGTPSINDVVALTYDGSNVRYYINTVLVKTSPAAGVTLYGYCLFGDPGAGFNSLRFGPTTNLAVIDTPQVNANAVSQIVSLYSAGKAPFPVPSITFTAGAPASNRSFSPSLSLTLTTTGAPVAMDVMIANLLINIIAGATAWQVDITVLRDTAVITGPAQSFSNANYSSPGTTVPYICAFTLTDSPAAGSHTYEIVVSATVTGGGAGNSSVTAQNTSFKVREIKK